MSNTKRNPTVQVRFLINQAVIADQCSVAESFFSRLKGLIGRKNLPAGQAMLFPQCNDIHMWFMSIPIDVVFLKRERRADGTVAGRVTSTRASVRPWKPLPVRDGKATDTLELPAGSIERFGIKPGDELCIS